MNEEFPTLCVFDLQIVDPKEETETKVQTLSKWIQEAKCVVIHCGAGISTSCGIPDFRGPRGVWTLEKAGIKDDKQFSVSFKDAIPSLSHRFGHKAHDS